MFALVSRNSSISALISSLTHCSFSTCCSSQVYTFPGGVLICWSLVSLRGGLRKCMLWFQVFFKLVRLFLWPVMWSILETIPCIAEKHVHSVSGRFCTHVSGSFVLLSVWDLLLLCWASVSSIYSCSWGIKASHYYCIDFYVSRFVDHCFTQLGALLHRHVLVISLGIELPLPSGSVPLSLNIFHSEVFLIW